jgi:hypothetical protein
MVTRARMRRAWNVSSRATRSYLSCSLLHARPEEIDRLMSGEEPVTTSFMDESIWLHVPSQGTVPSAQLPWLARDSGRAARGLIDEIDWTSWPGLETIVRYAADQRCDWVLLDPDGPEIGVLPSYPTEWEIHDRKQAEQQAAAHALYVELADTCAGHGFTAERCPALYELLSSVTSTIVKQARS